MMTEMARKNSLDDEERKVVKPMTVKWLESKELLFRRNGKLVPTCAYYIVAGRVPPGMLEPRIRCGAFKGKIKGDFYDRRECEGPIAEQIEDAYQFVVKNMRVGTKIVNSQRQEVYELPLSAVREAICNVAFHRDYLEPSNVFVAFFDDRLEITSPGGLVKDFTIEQAESGISKIRNMGLAAALEYMKDVEGWGGGVSRYFEKCAELGLPPPKIEELDGGFFRVTFYRDVRFGEIVNEGDEDRSKGMSKGKSKGKSKGMSGGRSKVKNGDRILALLSENSALRQSEIAEMVGLSLPGVEKIMRCLRNEGKLIREGSSRNGRWKVVTKG